MGEVGDEFSKERLVAKVKDLYYKSVFLTKNIFIPNTGYRSGIKKKTNQTLNNNFCVSLKVPAKTELLKLFLPWAVKKLSTFLPFTYINM